MIDGYDHWKLATPPAPAEELEDPPALCACGCPETSHEEGCSDCGCHRFEFLLDDGHAEDWHPDDDLPASLDRHDPD